MSNLQRARHLEGCLGEVVAFNRDSGRYLVQLLPPRLPPGAPNFRGEAMEAEEEADAPDAPEAPEAPEAPVSKLVLLQNLRPAVERTVKPPLKESNFI